MGEDSIRHLDKRHSKYKSKMKRHDFVRLAGSASMLALAGYSVFGQARNVGGLVNTPAKRLDYTRQLLEKLCTDLGPRPTGSEAFAKGAKIIWDEMNLTLPEVNYDSYEFERWKLMENPKFIIGGQRIEAIPATGSKGTPPEGIDGVLQKSDSGFVLVDPTTGEARVKITIAPFGKAITLYQPNSHLTTLPSISIGKQDVPLLENAVLDKSPIWIKVIVRLIPHAPGLNIVGKLPGKRKEEILFLAHADTVYNTPGANDNAASMIVMIMLAHAAAASSYNHTLTFVATDGEEFGKLGAKHYAEKCIAKNTLANIRYVINFDSLTYGPNLWISSQQEDIKDMLLSIHRDLNIRATPKFDNSDGFVLDSEPFRPSGAKALHANSRGYDEKTLPVYHRPDDHADNVPLDCVEISFLVFNEFLKRIDVFQG